METLSILVALCEGNPLVIGGFPSQRTNDEGLSFDVSFDVSLCKLLNKQLEAGELRWLGDHLMLL